MTQNRIAVIGGGSWGTAFAAMVARRHGGVALQLREPEVVESIRTRRENTVFLPGIALPGGISATTDLAEALSGASVVCFVVPSHHLRSVAKACAPHMASGASAVSLTKGLEDGTFKRMTEILAEELPACGNRIAALSGPTFAREVAEGKPTGATVASVDPRFAEEMQGVLSGDYFRLYAETDVVGIEVGGALKNVMAIAAGMSDGLGFGYNARALLIGRGLAEIGRAGVAMGADPQTFAGLAGLGDLVLTCTGDLSRNRTVGVRVGRGEKASEIVGGMVMVAEGVGTARVASALGRHLGVPMPVSEQVDAILHHGKDVREAVSELFGRPQKRERD